MRYGTIFSMDYEPRLRLMAVGQPPGYIWTAVVLVGDDPDPEYCEGWRPGQTISFDPADRGVTIIEETE